VQPDGIEGRDEGRVREGMDGAPVRTELARTDLVGP
jgi:hypothetical protein